MVANKDLKRLVRSRMQKTGESYTAARLHLLPTNRSTVVAAKLAVAAPAFPSPADYAKIAGMSDAAVKAKTGCDWASWVKSLDYHKAHEWSHRAIADHVHEKYKVPNWWTQMVTVGYERIKGLRERGQRRGGGYEATKSKVFPVPMTKLFRAFSDKRNRARWLPGVNVTVRTSTPNKSMRLTWTDGSSVELWFTNKARAKSQVQVQHVKLADKDAAVKMREFWSDRLAVLAEILAPAVRRTA